MTFNDPLFYLALIISYLIGSIPSGYILLKIFFKRDITKEGSGNVGTLNAYKVSRSKFVTSLVFILDFLKGFIPFYFLLYFNLLPFTNVLVCSIMIILGHNFPLWLNFKGGRGLATAAGVFALLNVFIILGWCLIWVSIFLLRKDVLLSNFIATLLLPLITYLCTIYGLHSIFFDTIPVNSIEFTIFVIALVVIILLKHTEIITKLFSLKTSKAG